MIIGNDFSSNENFPNCISPLQLPHGAIYHMNPGAGIDIVEIEFAKVTIGGSVLGISISSFEVYEGKQNIQSWCPCLAVNGNIED